jgi:hypothetical protein
MTVFASRVQTRLPVITINLLHTSINILYCISLVTEGLVKQTVFGGWPASMRGALVGQLSWLQSAPVIGFSAAHQRRHAGSRRIDDSPLSGPAARHRLIWIGSIWCRLLRSPHQISMDDTSPPDFRHRFCSLLFQSFAPSIRWSPGIQTMYRRTDFNPPDVRYSSCMCSCGWLATLTRSHPAMDYHRSVLVCIVLWIHQPEVRMYTYVVRWIAR